MSQKKITILKTPITLLSFDGVLEKIKKDTKSKRKITTICTPNPEISLIAHKNGQFAASLQKFNLALPDGMGLVWASRILGMPITERVSGVDMMENLIAMASDEGAAVGLIGGFGGVALEAGECLRQHYPRLNIFTVGDFAVDERGVEDENEEKILKHNDSRSIIKRQGSRGDSPAPPAGRSTFGNPKSLREYSGQAQRVPLSRARALERDTGQNNWIEMKGRSISTLISQYFVTSKRPAIIFVALGAPKQEFFIEKLNNELKTKNNKRSIVLMSVGGSLDIISGRLQRAPSIFQRTGLEWLWRLILQPWRIGRQARLLKFMWLVFREKVIREKR